MPSTELIMHCGKGISVVFPSGYFQFYCDKQGMFLTFDDLDDCKLAIEESLSE